MRHLFTYWPEFEAVARAAAYILFLADYDGTLAAIVERPEDAVLAASVRQKLLRLAANPRYSIGVISGREITELKKLVAIDGIYYAGNHGMEIEGPGLAFTAPVAAVRPVLAELGARLAEAMADLPGIIIQNKGMSLSVHYRLVKPELEDTIAATVHRLTAPCVARGDVRVYAMKKVWEIRPPLDWDKGKAVMLIGREIRAKRRLARLFTIYLGDDTTDEDAFRVLHRPEGWSVFVGGDKPDSAAEYYLGDVSEVEALLERLLKLNPEV